METGRPEGRAAEVVWTLVSLDQQEGPGRTVTAPGNPLVAPLPSLGALGPPPATWRSPPEWPEDSAGFLFQGSLKPRGRGCSVLTEPQA